MSVPFQFRPRTYLHFDTPISAARAETLATDPEAVARHSFYPLIGFIIETPRVECLPDGTKRRRAPKKRPIKLSSHADACIYNHYGSLLREHYERKVREVGISENVTAFRSFSEPGRNNVWFANEVFEFIQNNRPCIALALDVEKFFDRLDHGILKTEWAKLLGGSRLPQDHFTLFRNLTKFTWVEREEAYREMEISISNPRSASHPRKRICAPIEFRERIRRKGLVKFNPQYKQKRGIPQGTPISALLSNIYMISFDQEMSRVAKECGGLYRRYCDDIVLVVPPTHICDVESLAHQKVSQLRLALNEDKTNHVCFPTAANSVSTDGKLLQYLGFTFDGQRKLIRNGSLSRYYAKMRKGVKLARKTRKKINKLEQIAGEPLSELKRRKLHIRYSYLISRRVKRGKLDRNAPRGNFLTYAYNASKRMNAPEIKAQVRNHWIKLNAEIDKR